MLAALGILFVLVLLVKVVIALCGYTITWRLAIAITLTLVCFTGVGLVSCVGR